jgi:hypothetical protein
MVIAGLKVMARLRVEREETEADGANADLCNGSGQEERLLIDL